MTNIDSAAVVGAGYMGLSIAMVLAIAGIEAAIGDQEARASRERLSLLRDEAQQLQDANIFPEGSADVVSKGARPAIDILDCVTGADLVEEAIFKEGTAKREARAAIDALAPPPRPIRRLHASRHGPAGNLRGGIPNARGRLWATLLGPGPAKWIVGAGKFGAKIGSAFYPMPADDIAARAAKRDLAYAKLAIFKQRIEE